MTPLLTLTTALLFVGAPTAHAKRDKGPAASAAEIPALANLLEKAGWHSTPELSSVFVAGGLYEATELGHRLVSQDCIAVEPTRSAYTSAELVTSLQSGVSVRAGAGKVEASGSLMRKMRFGTPEQLSIPLLQFTLSDTCVDQLKGLPADRQDRIYAVQEVLVAEISEQTCGRINASGKFVGLGEADIEMAQACAIASLEPVAVGYRIAPLSELLPGGKGAAPPPAAVVDAASDAPSRTADNAVFSAEVIQQLFHGLERGDLAYQVEEKFGKPTWKKEQRSGDKTRHGGYSFWYDRQGALDYYMAIMPLKLTPEQKEHVAALLPPGLLDMGAQEVAAAVGGTYDPKERQVRLMRPAPGVVKVDLNFTEDHKSMWRIWVTYVDE